ncbi:MAG: SufD family Fe-S cluster assembly protein [Patescibacteria group bacterium]|jgi:Fe-S cluster assembly protein SufD
MKTMFRPISEMSLIPPVGDRIVVGANEKKFLSFGVEALAGEKKELFFAADVFENASLEVAVFVRGGGEILLSRTLNVLGYGAKVSLKCSGIMEGTGRVLAGDDVRVTGERAQVDIRTKIVLRDSAVSESRSRVVLEHSARGANAFARIDHLLLGEHAKGSSIPELDVRIDDVTCGHAASSSSLAPASLQYLTGRGLDEKTASDLLVHGFLDQGVSILSESEGSDFQA